MSSFYEAFERKRAEDLMHYGVRGMKWGIVNEPERFGRDPDIEWDDSSKTYNGKEDLNDIFLRSFRKRTLL